MHETNGVCTTTAACVDAYTSLSLHGNNTHKWRSKIDNVPSMLTTLLLLLLMVGHELTYWPSWSTEHHWVWHSIIQVFPHSEHGIVSTNVPCAVVTKWAAAYVQSGLVARLKTEEKLVVTVRRTGWWTVKWFATRSICFCVSVAEVMVELNIENVPSLQCVLWDNDIH